MTLINRRSLPGKSNIVARFLPAALFMLIIASCATVSELVHFDEYQYSGYSLDISGETQNARANFWRPDGSAIYVTGRGTENVASYTVSEPWQISTATFSDEFDLSNEVGSTSQSSVAHGLYLREDGERMWVFNRTEIWEYTLSTPWQVSSAANTSYFDLSDFVQRGHDFDFSPDGTTLFIDDRDAQAVHQTHLSTPWDITTIEWQYTLDISDQEQEVRGLEMIAGGSIMLLMDTGRKEVLQYTLTDPYDLKTAEFRDSFDVSDQTSDPRGLSIRPDFKYFYVTGRDTQEIYQYSRQ